MESGTIKENMETSYKQILWKFHWPSEEGVCIEGIFVATEKEIDKVMGFDMVFGDVYGYLGREDLTKITDDQTFITRFLRFGCSSGINPIEHVKKSKEYKKMEKYSIKRK